MSQYVKLGLVFLVAIFVMAWVVSMEYDTHKITSLGSPEEQKPAPDFVLRNVSGEKIALSQYKGKLVYLKFWASWCGDCVKQVVPQRELEEALGEKSNVVFLNISIDDDEAAWLKAVTRNKLSAVELISNDGEESQVSKTYALHEIPRYILISRDGVVLDNNAPKPSEIDAEYFSNYQ